MLSAPNEHEADKTPQFTGSLYFRTDHVDEVWLAVKDRVKVCYSIENFDYGMRGLPSTTTMGTCSNSASRWTPLNPGSKNSELFSQLIEIEVQVEHVHAGFAEEAKLAARDVLSDEQADVVF